MHRLKNERGAALILLLGIMGALAVLAATAVIVTVNTQHATAADRTQVSSLDYAEAGLDGAILAVRTQSWPSQNGAFAAADLKAAYEATYPDGPALSVQVYDNQNPVDKSVTWDKGSPSSPTTPDGELWVEASVTVTGRTSRVRELVGQVNTTGQFSVPAAAIYTDGNVAFTSGGGDVFGIKYDANGNWTADTTESSAVYAGGSFTGNWSTLRLCRSRPTAPSTTRSSGSTLR
jgi:Tfp pilus assembly protein PilX